MSTFPRVIQNLKGQRGDTIVEVLLAVAVLGAVLGGAYVVTNRNTVINRASQERLQAIKIAESQLERLKAKTDLDTTGMILQGNQVFCLTTANELVGTGDAACMVNSSGNPTTDTPGYRIAIQPLDWLTQGTVNQAGRRYEVRVTWANSSGSDDTLSYLYEVYR